MLLKNTIEVTMKIILSVCGMAAVLFVLTITAFLIVSGVPAMGEVGIAEFLFGTSWSPTSAEPSYGILPFILSSLYGTAGAIIIGVPIGIMCAVFIAKTAPEKISGVMTEAVDLMSGIPSVVYGLVGMIAVVPFIQRVFNLPHGANMFTAILVLAVMILPTVISVSKTAIRAVPREYEEGSLALGATKTETVFLVVVPAAKSGILTSVVLGIGRALGESMAIMMVSGNVANMPRLFGSVRFLTTAVASEMSYSSGLHREALFSIAFVLFVFILIINLIINFIIKRGHKNE